MCGICGYIDTFGTRVRKDVIVPMMDTLVHRGPDDSGFWLDRDALVALGHRRLSIVDLSETGAQPMRSSCGRYVLTFNGEIYNHRELRHALETAGSVFRGGSDTEVLLHAIRAWGLEESVRRSTGMFAFALWDAAIRTLTLVRDRFGEKPLYYGFLKGAFAFSSELKALHKHPAWYGAIDRNALAQYMRYNYVPSPFSIYRDVFKLPPGSYLRVTPSDVGCGARPQPVPYWSLETHVLYGLEHPFSGSFEEASESIESLLRQSIAGQMVADVPVGAFLSGGIDSSTVVALMQSQSSARIKTFTIGMESGLQDEAAEARAIADHLDTDHTELYLRAEDAIDLIPNMPALYDEPFGDSSQIPTYFISTLARKSVTVALSGDGGDELFGGYNRHYWAERLWHQLQRWPVWSRELVANGIRTVSPSAWNRCYFLLESLVPRNLRLRYPGDKLHKLARILPAHSSSELYARLLSHWHTPSSIVLGCELSAEPTVGQGRIASLTTQMMYQDASTYLPDDILVKVDRASMAASLESRTPFLDHHVAEVAFTLPQDLKIKKGVGKLPLRRILSKYVPDELTDRPKAGFGIPIAQWLRGPLRPWAEAMLNEESLKAQGFLDPRPIRRAWQAHLSGRENLHHCIWTVLMFQAWLGEYH